uniref:Amine oxidase domain-containing protein n=1 Tax=Trichuris muris TaxID=70415 RepID=A0A5S6QPI3_TRIMR
MNFENKPTSRDVTRNNPTCCLRFVACGVFRTCEPWVVEAAPIKPLRAAVARSCLRESLRGSCQLKRPAKGDQIVLSSVDAIAARAVVLAIPPRFNGYPTTVCP